MSEDTRDVLIDVTAVDHTKAVVVLNTIIAMFSEFCAASFTAEQVGLFSVFVLLLKGWICR